MFVTAAGFIPLNWRLISWPWISVALFNNPRTDSYIMLLPRRKAYKHLGIRVAKVADHT